MRKKIAKRKSKLGIIAMCLTMAVVMGDNCRVRKESVHFRQ